MTRIQDFIRKGWKPVLKGLQVLLLLAALPTSAKLLFEAQHAPGQKALEDFIRSKKSDISDYEVHRLAGLILKEAAHLDTSRLRWRGQPMDAVALLTGMVHTESSFSWDAVSKSGAVGYMQLLPPTGIWLASTIGIKAGVKDLMKPELNLRLGVLYMNMLIREFGDPRRATLAYNAGPGAVRRGRYLEAYWTGISRIYAEMRESDSTVTVAWNAD